MSLIYYTQSEINTIITELNSYYSSNIQSYIKNIETNNIFNSNKEKDFIFFSILLEIITQYKTVDNTTDNIINTISETKFQQLIKNIYEHYNIK